MIRAVILSATIAALYAIWNDQSPPVSVAQVDYCLIDMRVAGKDLLGEWRTAWVKAYRPCSLQDIYRDI